MKKFIFSLALLCLAAGTFAQGLISIDVEKYYVSNANDSTGAANAGAGTLPVGSVTWRIFAHLAAGYKLQAVYGVPGHNLVINSTTGFYNNEDNGGQTPNGNNVTNLRKHTALIDTWFSMTGGGSTKVGVPKAEDADGSVGNSNVPPLLQNNDASAAPAISVTDGLIAAPVGYPVAVQFVGFTAAELGVFDNISQFGNSINTNNASVAVLGGVAGPTATNQILIGQFTTKGVFHFELNLQIGTPSTGVENWIAYTLVCGDLRVPSLHG